MRRYQMIATALFAVGLVPVAGLLIFFRAAADSVDAALPEQLRAIAAKVDAAHCAPTNCEACEAERCPRPQCKLVGYRWRTRRNEYARHFCVNAGS